MAARHARFLGTPYPDHHPTFFFLGSGNFVGVLGFWAFCAFCSLAKCPLIRGVNEAKRRIANKDAMRMSWHSCPYPKGPISCTPCPGWPADGPQLPQLFNFRLLIIIIVAWALFIL